MKQEPAKPSADLMNESLETVRPSGNGAFAPMPQRTTARAASKPAWLAQAWRYRHFYLFISPFFILFAVFGLYPVLFSFFLSFMKWDGLTQMHWEGLGNFALMFRDDQLWRSLWNTLIIGLLYVPPMLIMAFLFAQVLNIQWLKLKAFWRAAFFLPCVTPMVVIAIVFTVIFSSDQGVMNSALLWVGHLLPFLHLQPIGWLTTEQWSKTSVAILVAWRWTGYNMVLMLAGLQGISHDYYEAASIDGASAFQRMRFITWPLLQPTFRFCLLLSVIGTLYMFDEPFVLTNGGGPGISSMTFGLYLFNTSFSNFKFGYASCVAYTIAIVVFMVTFAITRLNNRQREA
jgi:ABC-type sugar transport system permease subunit